MSPTASFFLALWIAIAGGIYFQIMDNHKDKRIELSVHIGVIVICLCWPAALVWGIWEEL